MGNIIFSKELALFIVLFLFCTTELRKLGGKYQPHPCLPSHCWNSNRRVRFWHGAFDGDFVFDDRIIGRFLENLAIDKKAYQSSDWYSDKGFADTAVDGDLTQTQAHCTHTNKDANSYWEVDLGKKCFIHHVTLYNRQDAYDVTRLRKVELYIGLWRNNYKRYGYYDGVVGSVYTFNLTELVVGQWVRITRIPSVAEYLSLCEVQVFGFNAAEWYFGVHEDQKGVETLVQASMRTKTIIHCSYMCYTASRCEAANYDPDTQVCDLFTSNSTQEAVGQSMLIPI